MSSVLCSLLILIYQAFRCRERSWSVLDVFAFDSRLTSDSERKPHEYLVNDIMMLNSFAWNKNDKKKERGRKKKKKQE